MAKFREFIFQMIVILFIFLITAQTIILKGDKFFVHRSSGSNEVKNVVAMWFYQFGRRYKVVITITPGSLQGEAKIIINAEKIIPLKGEKVELNLKTGDLVWLDARACREPVWLKITASNIKSELFVAGKEFKAWRELIFLGEVSEAGRL